MTDEFDSTTITKVSNTADVSTVARTFHNRLNLPPKQICVSDNPTKVQESPLDARSPQEVLDYHGMYRDQSYYEKNPDKLYIDLTQFDDYETYLNKMNDIKDKFNKLPVDVRARFNHNVSEFCAEAMKSDFDITRAMDDNTKKAYDNYKATEKAKAERDAYLASDEYKKAQKESALRLQYEQAQYEAWKAKQNITGKLMD